jgi:protein-disulfide isomerase
MKNPWVIVGVITVALFAAAFYFAGNATERNNEGIEAITHVKGNADAVVVLEEFSDFQCPACRAAHPVISGLLEEYSDQIRFEYKHFPIERAHPYAVQAATAAEAAGQQDKFYEFHDLLFENQQTWSQSPTPNVFFAQYATELELDMALFRRHSNASVLRDKVRAEMAEGRERGVTGTPTLFLNGQQMRYGTYEEFLGQVIAALDPSAVPVVEQDPDEAVVGETQGEAIRFGI